MAKNANTRINETIQFITNFGAHNVAHQPNANWVALQLTAWKNNIANAAAVAQVSGVLSQNNSTNRPGWTWTASSLRAYRRASILIEIVLLHEINAHSKQRVEGLVVTEASLKGELIGVINDARRAGTAYVVDVARGDFLTHRPLCIGIGISNAPDPGPGTIACFVTCNNTGDTMLLSNLHVVQNSMPNFPPAPGFNRTNNQLDPADFPGATTDIVQKAVGHGGVNPTHKVADFTRGFLRGGAGMGAPSGIDAGVCTLLPGIAANNVTPEGTAIANNPIAPAVGMAVWKRSCMSGIQHGVIAQINHTSGSSFNAKYGGALQMQGQIQITGNTPQFQISGDSGSLLIDAATNRPVGLMHGGAMGTGLATPIADVLAALQITII